MSYKGKIQFAEGGISIVDIINKESYAALSFQDWADWIKDRLHGHDNIIPYSRDGAPGVYFRYVARDLGGEVERAIHEGIRLCLDDAYKSLVEQREDWSNEGVDELLLLVNNIGYTIEDKEAHEPHPFQQDRDNIKKFLDIVEPRPDLVFTEAGLYENDLYFRVLQTLAGIKAQLPYEFWEQNLHHSPDKYAHICFGGASNNSPYDGIKLLPHIDWSHEKTRNVMSGVLMPFYYRNHSDAEVIAVLEEQKASLPEGVPELLDEAKSWAEILIEKDRRGEF